MTNLKTLQLILLGALAVPSLCVAQILGPAQVETARTARQLDVPSLAAARSESEEAEAVYAPSMEGDEEYGEQLILKRRASWDPWFVSTYAGFTWTDNAALLPAPKVSDWYFRTGAYVSYHPKIAGTLFGDFSASQYFYLYDEFDGLDFDALRTDAGLQYIMPNLWDIALFGRYGYERLTDSGFGDEIFTDHSLTIGLQKLHWISKGHQVFAGYSSEFSLQAEPSLLRRHEHSLYAGYSIWWLENFRTTLSYRGAVYNYVGSGFGRDDINSAVAFIAEYDLAEWATLNAGASFVNNASNVDVFDYKNWNLTGALSLKIRF